MCPTDRPFTVTTSNGDQLSCLLSSKSTTKSANNTRVVVLCHGYTASKNAPLMKNLSNSLLLKSPTDVSIARFDFSGNGSSTGQFHFGNYSHEANDLHAVVCKLRGDGYVVDAVVGHSKGASVVLLYAAKYGGVSYIGNLAGRFDMRAGLKERFGEEMMAALQNGKTVKQSTRAFDGEGQLRDLEFNVRFEDFEERVTMDIEGLIRALPKSVKVLTVHGDEDTVIPVQDGIAINGLLEDGELVVLPGVGHNFRGNEDKIADAFFDFYSS